MIKLLSEINPLIFTGDTMLNKRIIQAAIATYFLIFSAVSSFAATLSGVVSETMDSAGYTYMLVDEGGNKQWVAIPQTTVSVGDKVSYVDGMVMKNFRSETLDRTFDQVVFSTGLVDAAMQQAEPAPATSADAESDFAAAVAKEQQAPAAAAGAAPADVAAATSGGSSVAIVPMTDGMVEKAEGENSYTVGEIFAHGEKLDQKEVTVRGKVVKFSAQIMGRNWIHIQDGTGDPMHNSHDLVVTSDAVVAKDDIVTVTGTLAANKDFGAGYKYAVIIEQAAVKPQE